jgi:hypothetical protein
LRLGGTPSRQDNDESQQHSQPEMSSHRTTLLDV